MRHNSFASQIKTKARHNKQQTVYGQHEPMLNLLFRSLPLLYTQTICETTIFSSVTTTSIGATGWPRGGTCPSPPPLPTSDAHATRQDRVIHMRVWAVVRLRCVCIVACGWGAASLYNCLASTSSLLPSLTRMPDDPALHVC